MRGGIRSNLNSKPPKKDINRIIAKCIIFGGIGLLLVGAGFGLCHFLDWLDVRLL